MQKFVRGEEERKGRKVKGKGWGEKSQNSLRRPSCVSLNILSTQQDKVTKYLRLYLFVFF
jgi:hypothetical protein